MHITPAEGRVVLDPATGRPLPEKGTEVEPTQYWLRRLEDGDVAQTPAPKEPKQ